MQPILARVAAALLVCSLAAPAGAVVIGADVDVELLSPNDGLALSDTVTTAAGPELLPADGSNIGSVLLSSEFIDLDTDTITIRLEEGVGGGATGYGDNARYIFSELYATTDLGIVSVALSLSNISNFTLADVYFSARRVEVRIDDLLIDEQSGIDFGTITLTLTTDVPEPAMGLLLIVPLVGAASLRGGLRSVA